MSSLVFIYPQHVEFPSTFESQNISIFNPYEVPIHFHFQCTRPTAFLLSSSEGEILAKHSLEITVSLLDKTIETEKFQVRISLAGKGKILGEKIIKVSLKTNKSGQGDGDDMLPRRLPTKDHFQELPPTSYEPAKEYKNLHMNKAPHEYFIYVTLAICVLILCCPHEDNGHKSTNRILEVSVNFKLAAAYVLGIVTVFLIRN